MERLKVQVHTPAHIFTGYVHLLPQQRLLDILNGILAGTMRREEAFLPLFEASASTRDGKETALESAYINILFAREVEEGKSSERSDEVEHKLYPFITKSPVSVQLLMLGYTLTGHGQMHCAEGQHLGDVLKSETRFLPLTRVQIRSSAGGSESELDFVAVNKEQIIALQELGSAGADIRESNG